MAPRSIWSTIEGESDGDGDGEMHYLGVRKRQFGRYSAEIRDPTIKRRIWLGIFDSEEAAARAYDNAARRYRGPNAITNFPPLDLNVQTEPLNELLSNNETLSQSVTLHCSSNPAAAVAGSYPMQLSLFGRSFRTTPVQTTHMLRLRPESYQEIADEINRMRGFLVDGVSNASSSTPKSKGINVDLNLPPPKYL